MTHQRAESDDEPTLKLPTKLKGDVVWRIFFTILLGLNFFIKTNFVSKADYDADRKAAQEKYDTDRQAVNTQIYDIKNILTKMTEENKVNERQEDALKDHEVRIRALELRAAGH